MLLRFKPRNLGGYGSGHRRRLFTFPPMPVKIWATFKKLKLPRNLSRLIVESWGVDDKQHRNPQSASSSVKHDRRPAESRQLETLAFARLGLAGVALLLFALAASDPAASLGGPSRHFGSATPGCRSVN